MALEGRAGRVDGGVTVARFHIFPPVDERTHLAYIDEVAENGRLRLLALQTEKQPERVVDRLHLHGLEPPRRGAQALWINDRGLLDEHARRLALERDLRSEARRPCTRRCGGDEDGAQHRELVRLYDHGVARAALLVAAAAA